MILPLFSAALSLGAALGAGVEAPVVVTAPRTAQVQLAVTLSEADAIHSVHARAGSVVFAIEREGRATEIAVRTKSARDGAVTALTITDLGPALGGANSLAWLGAELADATAVTAVTPDEDGAVTITTSDGRAYMAIPGRGSGGNAAVEARWAAAWSSTDG
ncbi:MAG: hypothetical protein JNL83_11220 [Myxococcales bacterium]|nr:hypothetical protein [Myxococcales bacterium]